VDAVVADAAVIVPASVDGVHPLICISHCEVVPAVSAHPLARLMLLDDHRSRETGATKETPTFREWGVPRVRLFAFA
jgi:hypothetical protein